MKICLYSPYVPKHFGGGEKYFFDVAQTLASKHQVIIGVPAGSLKADTVERYETFLGYSLAEIEWQETPLGSTSSWWQKLSWTKQFDALYYITDGSFFFSLAGKNIAHIQFPFANPQTGLVNRLKLHQWSNKNTNSAFTKKVIEQAWHTNVPWVHYPMIELPKGWKARRKERIILNVGRFFRHLHSKRQDVLVEAFRQLRNQHKSLLKGWQLVLIGNSEDDVYAKKVAAAAADLPVTIIHKVDREELWQWYNRASIYWHATGFEVDETTEPLKVEHFGISTVEAMLAGCVPVVVNKGGQTEVLGPKLQGLGWQTIDEAAQITASLLQHPQALSRSRRLAQQQARTFGSARFKETLWQMLVQ